MSTWLSNKRVRLLTFLIVTISLILPQSIWLSSTPVAQAATNVTVTGVILGAGRCNEPIENADVGLYNFDNPQSPQLIGSAVQTNNLGQFTLNVTVPDATMYELHVMAKKNGYRDTEKLLYQGNGPIPATTDIGNITLDNASFIYRGQVYDANTDDRYPNNYRAIVRPTDPKRPLQNAIVEMVVTRNDDVSIDGSPYGTPALRRTVQTDAQGNYVIGVGVPTSVINERFDVTLIIRKNGFVRYESSVLFNQQVRTCQQEFTNPRTEDAGLEPGYTIINKLADVNSKDPITTSGWEMELYDMQGNRQASKTTNLDSDGWFRTEFAYNQLDIDPQTGTSPDRVFFIDDVGNYPSQYLGIRADTTIEGKLFKDATPYNLNPRGTNNLDVVELYSGAAVSGIFYDHQADKTLQDAWPNIKAYDAQKNPLGTVGMASFDNQTGAYATKPIFPGDVYLEFEPFIANVGEDNLETQDPNDKINYRYISRFLGTDKPAKTDYYLASAQKVTIPATGDTVTGRNVYFDRCAQIKGKVSAASTDMTYVKEVSVADYPNAGNTWVSPQKGSGSFEFELYDPNTGDKIDTDATVSLNSDASYIHEVCDRQVATLGQFKYRFEPGTTTSVVLEREADTTVTPPISPIATTTSKDYTKDFLPFWQGSNVYSIRDAKAQTLTPGDVQDLNINFERGAIVTGRLTDEKTGKPIDLINDPYAYLIRQGQTTGTSFDIGATGYFTYANVAPGNYMVKYTASGYRDEYFDDKWEMADADVFKVEASNADTPNTYTKDAALAPNPNLGMRLLNKETSTPVTNTNLTVRFYKWDNVNTAVASVSGIKANGIYTTTLPPGRYRVRVSGWGFETQWYDQKMGLDGRIADDIILGKDDVTVDMTLQGRYGKGSFTGQVVREDTQAPIEGANVVAVHDAFSGDELATFPTNKFGEYTIGNVLDGEYNLRFSYGSLVPEYHKDVLDIEDATDLIISGTNTIQVDRAELAAGGQIGVLVTAGGRPVPSITVKAIDSVTGRERGHVTTLPDGTGVIYGLPPGNYILTTEAWKQYEAYRSQGSIVVVANRQTDAPIELKEGAFLVGQVQDDKSGQPINDVSVQLFRTDIEEAVGSAVKTNAQGYYQINGVTPGQYIVKFWREGYKTVWQKGDAPKWDDAQPVDVTLGANSLGASLKREAGGFISGRVTLPGGQPARGVKVVAHLPQGAKPITNQQGNPAEATTDETGVYLIGDLKDDSYSVQFLPPSDTGYAMEWYNNHPSSADADDVSVTAETPATDVNAMLEKAPGVILGTVKVGTTDIPSPTLAAEPGTPVKDAKVVVYRADTHDKVGEAMTQYDGSYKIKGLLPESTYKAEVTAASPSSPICVGGSNSDDCYAGQWYNLKPTIADADEIDLTKPMTPTQTTSPTLMVDTEEVSATVDFLLYKSGISGRVMAEDGTPLPGSTVTFNGTSSVRTDATGHYTSTSLSSGEYKVAAMAHPTLQKKYNLVESGVYTKTDKVKVPMAGIIDNIDITIAAAATLSGTIMITPTKEMTSTQPTTTTLSAVAPVMPVAGVTAMLHKKDAGGCASSATASTVSDRRGNYVFEKVLPGEYCLSLYPPSQGPTVGYGNQWFDGVFDPKLAQGITLMAGKPTVQDVYLVKSPLRVPSTIKGVVVDQVRLPPPPKSGQPSLAATKVMTPLEGFTVKLYELDTGGTPSQLAASAVTNNNGEYELTGLEPGKPYKIRVEPPAIGTDSDYVPHWFDRVLDPNRAVWVAVPNGATKVITITAMRKLFTIPLKAGKWICLDPRTNEVTEYAAPRPLLWCTFIPAGALNRDINLRFTRIEKDESASAALSSASLQEESVAPTEQTAFFFDVEAYWVDSGEVVTQTEEAVTMSIPYTDPDDLVYTPTGAMTPTKMSEGRLKVNFWNDETVTSPVSGTTGMSETTYAPGWYDPSESPWCTAGTDCGQSVDSTNNLVSVTTNQFFEEYALLEGPPLSIYLPFIMREPTQPTTPTVTMTLTLR